MGTYPTSPRAAFLDWARIHEPIFIANAAQIGLTVEQANAFKAGVAAASAGTLAQTKAKEIARLATAQAQEGFKTLAAAAGDAVRSIRAFAETSADPLAVYLLAQLPPPAPPSPAPPPAQPTDLRVTLDPGAGTLTLRWKAANPAGTSGTSYVIRRRLPGQTEFSFLGVSGKKSFVDATLLAGPDKVEYTVQGQRADQAGPISPIFTVNFGRTPDGTRQATVSVGPAEALDAALNVPIPPPRNAAPVRG